MEVQNISLGKLTVDEKQTRITESVDELLVESIEENGVLQNLVVRPTEDKKGYKIISGSRRFRAAKRAGLDTVPCAVYDVDSEKALLMSLEENELRKDLTQYELTRSVQMWFEQLCEELPQPNQNGNFVSPVNEEKSFDSRTDLKNHISKSEPSHNLCEGVLTQEDVKKKIAQKSSFGYGTVKRLLRIASLPYKALVLLKEPEERDKNDIEFIEENYPGAFTLASSSSSAVSTKMLEIAKFYRKVRQSELDEEYHEGFLHRAVSKAVERKSDKDGNITLSDLRLELNETFSYFDDWSESETIVPGARIQKAIRKEKYVPEEKREPKDKRKIAQQKKDENRDENTVDEKDKESKGEDTGKIESTQKEVDTEEADTKSDNPFTSGTDTSFKSKDTDTSSTWTEKDRQSQPEIQNTEEEENENTIVIRYKQKKFVNTKSLVNYAEINNEDIEKVVQEASLQMEGK